jgi:heptosyltransferase-3
MQKILVIYVARLGDTLLITPVLRHLKYQYPHAHLTFLGHKRSIDLLRHLPCLDKIGVISKAQAPYLRWLSAKTYDLALVYGQDQALIRYSERVAHRVICFEQENFKSRQQTILVAKPGELIHAVDERAMLLNPLGSLLTHRYLSYQVSTDEQSWATNYCRDRHWHNRILVALKPNSFVDKSYRDWPNANVLEFCHLFHNEHPQSHFLFLGSHEDQPLIAPLLEKLSSRATSLAGQLSLRQTAAIMNQAQLYVGVDTGLTHLAGALSMPMVALYHCRHRGKYLAPLERSFCQIVDHPCPDHLCSAAVSMGDIAADQVLKAAQFVLAMS